jgi:lipopolysaccharide biosynthesis regulator YciM
MLNDLGAGFWLTLAGTLAIGWTVTAGRAALRRRRRVKRRESYLEGVRYLLDDESDRALEVFLGLSELDDSTVDTHFALGSLYRRRGEVERAIKVHEHIAERTNIDRRHRDTARTELAKDLFRVSLTGPRRSFTRWPMADSNQPWPGRTSCGFTRSSTTGSRPRRRTSS